MNDPSCGTVALYVLVFCLFFYINLRTTVKQHKVHKSYGPAA